MAKKPATTRHTPISRPTDRLLDVTVVVLEHGYASTAIAPIEIFHSAGVVWNWLHGETERPRFRVRTASVDGRKVSAAGSLALIPDCAIKEIKHTDIILIAAPGWDELDRIARDTPLVPWLRKWHARGAFIAGACTGVAYLAEAGLLDGHQATTHWGVADIYRKRYPKVRWRAEQFVTEDGRIFCSGGVYASIDLSLYLVEKICSSISPAISRSTISPSEPEWARAISFAVSRPQPAACLAAIFRRCASRLPRNCSRPASLRSRPSARRSATRTLGFFAICSNATPE